MNPQEPAAMPAVPVSDSQAMAGIINSFGAPSPPNNSLQPTTPAEAPPPEPSFQLDFSPPNESELVAPPMAPPAPLPIQQPVPQPVVDPNTIPLPYNQPAAPQADQPPAWAQGLMNDIAALKQQTGQAPTADWKPEGWQDVDARIAERVEQGVTTGLTQAQAQQSAAAAEETAERDRANQYIDTQINQLETTGYLPRIQNPTDPADPGRVAHQELFAYALSQGTDYLMAVAPSLYTLHQNGYYYDRAKNALIRRGSQTAAAQAPIAGSSPTATVAGPAGPSLRDLGTKDLTALAEEANRAFPLS